VYCPFQTLKPGTGQVFFAETFRSFYCWDISVICMGRRS